MDTSQVSKDSQLSPASMATTTSIPQVEAVSVAAAPPRGGNKLLIILVAVFLLILGILVGGAAIYFIGLNSGKSSNNAAGGSPNNNNNGNGTPISYQTGNQPTQKIITVSSPVLGDTVNGKIEVTGTATAILQELTIKVYDDSNNLIGTGVGGLASGNPNPIHNWFANIDVTKSPAVQTGKIKVYPADEGESSSLTVVVPVNFETITSEQVILYSPLKYQIMSGATIEFRGKMKDFFEGNLLIQVFDANGTKLVEDNITASSENYNQFADFKKNISIVVSSNTTATGSVKFVAVSPLDGRENIIITQPVRFR